MFKQFSWNEIAGLIPWPKRKAPPGLCCLSFDNAGIYSAFVVNTPNQQPELKWCEFTPHTGPNNISKTLKELVAKRQLAGINCSWVLQRNDYKLLTIEALPVKPEELAAAARWHVKDLINFPVDKALIEVFPAPFSLVFGKPNNLQVAVAEGTHIQTMAKIISATELNLQIIDIPELALRNITSLFSSDNEGLGLLKITPTYSKIIITKQGCLYVTREIDLALPDIVSKEAVEVLTPAAQSQLEGLAFEIQRSFDYYRSQLKQPLPAKLLVSMLPPYALNYLAGLLAQPMELLNLAAILNNTQENLTQELLSNCLTVIGGALRREENHVTTS